MEEYYVNDIVWFDSSTWRVAVKYDSSGKKLILSQVGTIYIERGLEEVPPDAMWLIKYGTPTIEVDIGFMEYQES